MAKHVAETLMSYAAGIIYAIGFWLWIDATVIGSRDDLSSGQYWNGAVHVRWTHWIPMVVGTLCIFLVNLPPHQLLFGDNAGLGDDGQTNRVRIWLLVSMILSFGALAAAIWISAAVLLREWIADKWPGVSLIISNVLIFASSLVYRFQRAFEEQDTL